MNIKYPDDDELEGENGANIPITSYTDEELERMIDSLYEKMDKNKDGYIEYSEYKRG